MHPARRVSRLLMLQLVFCIVITFDIRTVVERSRYIPQHNLWSWSGKGFLAAFFVWKPCPFSFWETIDSLISSAKPSLTVTLPLSSPSRDITVWCDTKELILLPSAPFVPCNLVHGPFLHLEHSCNDLFTCRSPHQTEFGTGRTVFYSLLYPGTCFKAWLALG